MVSPTGIYSPNVAEEPESTGTFRKADGTKSDVDKTGFPPKPGGTGSQLTVKSDLVFPATSEHQTKNPRADNESKREIAELLRLHASSSSSNSLVIRVFGHSFISILMQ